MRIKICGLTRAEDAEMAHDLGAWALGYIFAVQSPRRITVETANRIIQPDALNIAVFADQTDFAIDVLKSVPFKSVQLHGTETAEECRKIRKHFDGIIIKAFRSGLAHAADYHDSVDYILADGAKAGTVSDWNDAANYHGLPLILAGGLHAGNIMEAERQVRPFALDLSSGVESAPGIKDAGKLKELFKETHA